MALRLNEHTSLLLSGATIIDGVGDRPIVGRSIWIEANRIKAIGRPDEFGAAPAAKVIDAGGKYVIPGLMNANVHLAGDFRVEAIIRYEGEYDGLIAESAQVALKNGLTTVFDTWGPRRLLCDARDRINAGEMPGSRIFLAGNIVGLDGPLSRDHVGEPLHPLTPSLMRRINALWVENTGAHLTYLTPEQVGVELRAYIARGVDFIKYAANCHPTSLGGLLAFSERAQAAITREAHTAGITAQAHIHTVEGLRTAVEAGCDVIQHANMTGPVAIPEATLELLAMRKTGVVVFPFTERALEWLPKHATENQQRRWSGPTSDVNARNLIRCDARILLANDGVIFAPYALSDSTFRGWHALPEEDGLTRLATGHFVWLQAMEEKGMAPIEILKAATTNVATAYGKGDDLGTIRPEKLADLLLLQKNPLEAAVNYRTIDIVIKDGAIVDREALPLRPILTKPAAPPTDEELLYTRSAN